MIVEKEKKDYEKNVCACVCIQVDGQISVKLRMKCYWIEKKIFAMSYKIKRQKSKCGENDNKEEQNNKGEKINDKKR